MAGAPVFITVPKFVAISPVPIRPASAASPAEYEDAPKTKKRRLDHLTWEEKIQRKKLKNRVAAQTSRDRKKARMEEMEHEIMELNQTTQLLQNKCVSLQAINESLLEKNQKLDLEVENLRQKLTDLEEQHKQHSTIIKEATSKTVVTCAGCESILNGSAAGLNSHRLTVDTKSAEKMQHAGLPLEDSCSLPTLQDMLLIEEEFDAGRLEELAESLLADITADLEAGNRSGNKVAAQDASNAERLSGSVVGTTAKCVESGKHSTAHESNSSLRHENDFMKIELETDTENETQVKMEKFTDSETEGEVPSSQCTFILPNKLNTNIKTNMTQADNTAENLATHTPYLPTPPDTVYGTYDAKTNSITIVMGDDDVPVNEAVEEIYCDDVTLPQSADSIEFPATPIASPSQVYLNVDYSDEEDDGFDPIAKFLCPKRPILSPLGRSPTLSLHSITSDHGYESILGSPSPSVTDHFKTDIDDFSWNNSFNELFPSLV